MSTYNLPRAEHEVLSMELDRLSVMARAPSDCLPSGRWWRLLSYELDTLAAALDAQMKLEESGGGYMHELLEEKPSLEHRAMVLQAQHATLRDTLCSLTQNAHRHEHPDEIRSEIRRLLDGLAAHEHAETQLVQEGWQLDISAAD